jgi:TonB family protein
MMAEKRFLRPFVIASLVAGLGLAGVPLGTSMAWAVSHEKAMQLVEQRRMMRHKPPTAAEPTASPFLTEQTPTTLDAYTEYVQNKLQAEAMNLGEQGVADVKLTIDKDGTVRQSEVVRAEGSPALRDQVASLVNQMGKLPPLPSDADVLVMTATVATEYPNRQLYDRFGRLSR